MRTDGYLYRYTAWLVLWLAGPWVRALLADNYIGEWRIDSETGKRHFHIYSAGELEKEWESDGQ